MPPRGKLVDGKRTPSRREFLKAATVAAAATLAAPLGKAVEPGTLPTVALGPYRVTRLVAGSNPLYGGSHFNRILSALMREYFTDERGLQFLLECEKAGINTWQGSYGDRPRTFLARLRDAGSKLNWICLAGSWERDPAKMSLEDIFSGMMQSAQAAAKDKPIGIAYHGEVSDRLYRIGKLDQLRDFLNGVHDLGIPAGVSTHNPAVIEAVEEKGWPADFYMGCFYRESRLPAEFEQEIGVKPVGETYLASDPPRMCRVIRQTPKPCLGFKILAAGRRCDSPEQVREAFEFAFKNIKPTDATIVGMFPRLSDQISEDARLTREFTSEVTS